MRVFTEIRYTEFLIVRMEVMDYFANPRERKIIRINSENPSLEHVVCRINPINKTNKWGLERQTDVGPHGLKRDARNSVFGDYVCHLDEVWNLVRKNRHESNKTTYYYNRSDIGEIRKTSMVLQQAIPRPLHIVGLPQSDHSRSLQGSKSPILRRSHCTPGWFHPDLSR
jgi:hypothetical protein